MSNWKAKAAQSIVNHEAPAQTVSPQAQLHAKVAGLLGDGLIAARDLDFVKSLQSGFVSYGSWTPRQFAALSNIVDRPASESADKALADALTLSLPGLSNSDRTFAESLLGGFARYGSFTDRQRPHVRRLTDSVKPIETAPAAPVVLAKLYPNLCGLVNLDKFARFTVGDLQASLKNDGSCIWLKFDATLFGVITSATGAFRALSRGLTSDQHKRAVETLDIIEADPAKAAKECGILTGRCSCCGRPLTDPTSIAIGVGPICLGKAGW